MMLLDTVTTFISLARPYNSYSTASHTLILVFERYGFVVGISYDYEEIERLANPSYLARVSRIQAFAAIDKAVLGPN